MPGARYRVEHTTRYEYGTTAILAQQLLRLTPRSLPWQQVLTHEIEIEPAPSERRTETDAFGNEVVRIALAAGHGEFTITARSSVEVRSRPVLKPAVTSVAWESVAVAARTASLAEAGPFLFASPLIPTDGRFAEYARPDFMPGRPILQAVLALTSRLHADLHFDSKATTVTTPVADVLAMRRGVCQDYAHLAIACLRSLGVPARYVSGYLLTRPPAGRPRLVGADASHAWFAVLVPEAGWIDLDPTNDIVVDLEHVTLGWGRDFSDVSPLRGVILGGGQQDLSVAVTVTPLDVPLPDGAVELRD